jgi:uncharacterized protein YcbX
MTGQKFPVTQLWTYPIKGLCGRLLPTADLTAGAHFPGDRRFAIGAGHDAVTDNDWLKKAYFLQLMSFAEIAAVTCDFEGNQLRLAHDDFGAITADMDSPQGRIDIAAFFDRLLQGTLRGPARMVTLEKGAFTDTKAPLLSLGGSASFAGFGALTNTPPDPRRFRLNIIFETETPFQELALIGSTLGIGDVRLRVTEPVGRCAAIDVDPQTAIRGPHYLPMMKENLGHSDLGIFAEVLTGGTIAQGDMVTALT